MHKASRTRAERPLKSLDRIFSKAGITSRSEARKWISAGRVRVNGQPVRVLGAKVDPGRDAVTLDGKPVRARRKLYVALHKPAGYVCSRRDELGRPTVYDLLPKEWQNLHSVGRLDFNTEGLLFLTNDGQFALCLTHPRYGVGKKYVATVEGAVNQAILERFLRGVWHAGEKLQARAARLISAGRKRSVVELELAEGKNREVRRLFESQGLTLKRLQRTQIDKIKLGELKPGRWRALTETEIKTLLAEI